MLKNRYLTSWLCKAILFVVSLLVSVVDKKAFMRRNCATFFINFFPDLIVYMCIIFEVLFAIDLLHSFNTSSSLSVILKTWWPSRHSGWSQIQSTTNPWHLLLPCAIHLSTSECFFSSFVLYLKTGCYVYLLPCQNYQKQHGLFSCSNAWNHERSGKACMFFSFFNKGLVVWDDVSEETTHMISFHLSCTPWGCEGGKEWEGIWVSTKIRSIFYAQADFIFIDFNSIAVQKCESINSD